MFELICVRRLQGYTSPGDSAIIRYLRFEPMRRAQTQIMAGLSTAAARQVERDSWSSNLNSFI